MEYTKKQLAEILSNHNVEGKRFIDSEITSDMLKLFNDSFTKHLEKYPEYDPFFGEDYEGQKDDDFFAILKVVFKKGGFVGLPESKAVANNDSKFFESIIKNQISEKRFGFIVESLKSEDKEISDLSKYFSNEATQSEIVKYFGTSVLEEYHRSSLYNHVLSFVNSVKDGGSDKTNMIQSIIEHIENDESLDLLVAESLTDMVCEYSAMTNELNFNSEYNMLLESNLLNYASSSIKICEHQANVDSSGESLRLINEKFEETIVTDKQPLKIVETFDDYVNVKIDEKIYPINKSLIKMVESKNSNILVVGKVYENNGELFKMQTLLSTDDGESIYSFDNISSGENVTINQDDIMLPTIETLKKITDVSSQQIQVVLQSDLSLEIKNISSDPILTFETVFLNLKGLGYELRVSMASCWYLFNSKLNISWDLPSPQSLVININMVKSTILSYVLETEKDLLPKEIFEKKMADRKIGDFIYANATIVCEKLKIVEKNDFSYVCENESGKKILILETEMIEGEKIEQGGFSDELWNVEKLKNHTEKATTTSTVRNNDMDKEIETALNSMGLSKEEIVDFLLSIHGKLVSADTSNMEKCVDDWKKVSGFKQASVDESKNYKNKKFGWNQFSELIGENNIRKHKTNSVFEFRNPKTNILIGEFDYSSKSGVLLEGFSVQKILDVIQDKFDDSMLRLINAYLFPSKDPYKLDKNELSANIVNYFIDDKNTSADKVYDMFFKAYESIDSNPSSYDTMDYFGVMDMMSVNPMMTYF